MKFFDIEARKLNPDLFITGRDSTLPTGSQSNRQITKDGKRSLELSNIVLGTAVNDFAMSMICMPISPPEIIVDCDLFSLELIDENRYKITVGEVEEVIPFDNTCHYLYLARTVNQLTLIIDKKRFSYDVEADAIPTLTGFVGTGGVLVDKLMFSKSAGLMRKEYYDGLIPDRDIVALDQESYLEWVFAYDMINPRIFTHRDAELIDSNYITPVTMLEGESNTIRNLSRYPLQVTYDAGANWVTVSGVEKISPLVDSVIVKSTSRDFEFVLDSYDSETISLPGVTVDIDGAVYPYHRDERTFYTNAEYDFSSASVHINPVEGHTIKSIWLYGRLSPEVLSGLGVIRLYRDGVETPIGSVNDSVNRLYLIVLNKTTEVVLNPSKSAGIGINALGISNITNELSRVQQAFNLFAGNATVSYAEEAGSLQPGIVPGTNSSYRIIDVQWTI